MAHVNELAFVQKPQGSQEGENKARNSISKSDLGQIYEVKKEISVLDSPTPVNVQPLFPALKPTQKPFTTAKALNSLPAKGKRAKDHIWSFDTCYDNGCRECCACAQDGFQCYGCSEYNFFDHGRELTQAELQEWYEITSTESDGYLTEDMEVIENSEVSNHIEAKSVIAEAENPVNIDNKMEEDWLDCGMTE